MLNRTATLALLAKENGIQDKEQITLLNMGYEHGMTELLEGIAVHRQYHLGEPPFSPESKAQTKVASEKLELLKATLNEEQKALLNGFDDASIELTTHLNSDHFIQGFIEGYKFLMEIVEHKYI